MGRDQQESLTAGFEGIDENLETSSDLHVVIDAKRFDCQDSFHRSARLSCRFYPKKQLHGLGIHPFV